MVSLVRPRRGVRYTAEEQDIQDVLRMFQDRGRELDELLLRRRNAYQAQIRAMNFIVGHSEASASEHAEASTHAFADAAQVTLLNAQRTTLAAWLSDVRLALRSAQRTNYHARVVPGALWLPITYPVGVVRVQEELRNIRTESNLGLQWFVVGERFLKAVEHLLPPDLLEQCHCGLRPPRPPHGDDDADCGGGAGMGGMGVMAAPMGRPERVASHVDGYQSGWDTQARFFSQGTPIAYNVNHRRYTFSDDSHVDIQAYTPVLTTSTTSRLMVIASMAVLAAAGAVVGPLTLAAGAGLGLATGFAFQKYNAVWQAYTARYYSGPTATVPSAIRHFYGWKKSSGVLTPVAVDLGYDPEKFPNFADKFAQYSWWSWNVGNATVRPPRFDGCGLAARKAMASALESSDKRAIQLIQELNVFATPAGAESAIPSAPLDGALDGAASGRRQVLLVQAAGH